MILLIVNHKLLLYYLHFNLLNKFYNNLNLFTNNKVKFKKLIRFKYKNIYKFINLYYIYFNLFKGLL